MRFLVCLLVNRVLFSRIATTATVAWRTRNMTEGQAKEVADLARLEGATGRHMSLWVHDTKIRYSWDGTPRHGNLYGQGDAPLTDGAKRIALRNRIGLPQERLYRDAQRISGCAPEARPLQVRGAAASRPIKADGLLPVVDATGWGAGAETHDGYMTHRHVAIARELAKVIRAGGLDVATEEATFAIVGHVHRARAKLAKEGRTAKRGGLSQTSETGDAGDASHEDGEPAEPESEDSTLPTAEESRMRMDLVVRATVADVRALAGRHSLIGALTKHVTDQPAARDSDPVLILLDHSVAHPGPHMDAVAGRLRRLAKDKALPDDATDDAVGDCVFRTKRDKYEEATRRLSGQINAGSHMVFLPLPINAFGRLHPVTWHAFDYFIRLAASHARGQHPVHREEERRGTGDEEVESPQWLSAYQRNKWRTLATVLQQSLAEKVYHTMTWQCHTKAGVPRRGGAAAVAGGRANKSKGRRKSANPGGVSSHASLAAGLGGEAGSGS